MKLALILTTIAATILSLNVDGLHDSAKRADEINVTDTNSRSKDKSATGAIDHTASDTMQPSCDSINGTASREL